MSDMQSFSTPMMQQYARIKEQYSECLLFFRLGDFYELFLDDALIGARVLGITLTKRPRGKDGDIPMAGVPYHAANTYIHKLIKSGYNIAICEQITEPNTKGIVERAVVRIITPGTVLDESSLIQKKHNYVLSVSISAKQCGIAVADVSTGHFLVTQFDRSNEDRVAIQNELQRFSPQEIIVSPKVYNDPTLLGMIANQENCFIAVYPDWESKKLLHKKRLQEQFGLTTLKQTDLETRDQALEAASNLLSYLEHTQQQHISHVSFPEFYVTDDSLLLDSSTVTNLEIFGSLRFSHKQGSILGFLDTTSTAGGGRLLHTWLSRPLSDLDAIQLRLDAVDELYKKQQLRSNCISALRNVYDIERQVAKLSLNMATAAAVINIRQSLELFIDISEFVETLESKYWHQWKAIPKDTVKECISLIDSHLEESKKQDTSAVYIIRSGIHRDLDKYRSTKADADAWLMQFEQQERARTGISTLKCKYNSVFGFYIEVSNANLSAVPENYERKQTLVNAERFITPELKEHELLVLSAEEKITALEQEIFTSLVKKLLTYTDFFKEIALQLSQLDVISTFAQTAQTHSFCKPTISTSDELRIVAGRHPVVEDVLKEKFVPNDVYLNASTHQLLLITGPNMAGKSVVMRQVASIVLLAHIGSFVPANSAEIPLTDRIFVRSGASDNISDGLSTFMVEMVEAAYILRHATSKSLVIMDEIGRGTSTYDGISIAWAIVEYLVRSKQQSPKVLFATHYHELQVIADDYPNKVKNYKVAVERHNGKPLFLYTLQPGKSSHSFGISVAELAGVPEEVVVRASELLQSLESKVSSTDRSVSKNTNHAVSQTNTTIDKIIKKLKTIDVNSLTPLQSLQVLADLKEMSNDKNT